MNGTLFSQDYLALGITQSADWRTLDEIAFAAFRSKLTAIYAETTAESRPNEAATESELIFPTLESLGWVETLPQQTANRKGREEVPDALLFADGASKMAALKEKHDERRYTHGLAIVESKRWLRPLDRSDTSDADYHGTPSAQILRYLSRVEVASDRRIQWGMLTNGRHWRLYWQGARSRAEQFLELDLGALLQVQGIQPDLFSPEAAQREHYLKVFWLLLRREAFLPQADDAQGRSFHALALEEGRHWEARISEDLGQIVFDQVFPDLVRAIVAHDR
ncbi:MAG: restriction endonuclease, partial [Pseudomonadota bacterium]